MQHITKDRIGSQSMITVLRKLYIRVNGNQESYATIKMDQN